MKRTRIRPVSDKQLAAQAVWREVTEQRAADVDYRCEAAIDGVCEGRGAHGHHVIMRSTKRIDTYENCRFVCWADHRYLHAHLEWAESVGLIGRIEVAA